MTCRRKKELESLGRKIWLGLWMTLVLVLIGLPYPGGCFAYWLCNGLGMPCLGTIVFMVMAGVWSISLLLTLLMPVGYKRPLDYVPSSYMNDHGMEPMEVEFVRACRRDRV